MVLFYGGGYCDPVTTTASTVILLFPLLEKVVLEMVAKTISVVIYSQLTLHIESMLAQCWPDVCDFGPTLSQHRFLHT